MKGVRKIRKCTAKKCTSERIGRRKWKSENRKLGKSVGRFADRAVGEWDQLGGRLRAWTEGARFRDTAFLLPQWILYSKIVELSMEKSGGYPISAIRYQKEDGNGWEGSGRSKRRYLGAVRRGYMVVESGSAQSATGTPTRNKAKGRGAGSVWRCE